MKFPKFITRLLNPPPRCPRHTWITRIDSQQGEATRVVRFCVWCNKVEYGWMWNSYQTAEGEMTMTFWPHGDVVEERKIPLLDRRFDDRVDRAEKT